MGISWKRSQVALVVLLVACSSTEDTAPPSTDAAPAPPTTPSTTPASTPRTTPGTTPATSATPATAPADLPVVESVTTSADTVATYERLDLFVDVSAEYDNHFDQREIALDLTLTSPTGTERTVPGFWHADDGWTFRITADEPGEWLYDVVATDARGASRPTSGTFSATASDHPGFIRVGSDVDPDYSTRYFAHDDGTPWFGYGHADLEMAFGGFSGETFSKMADMAEIGENFEMWWPQWSSNLVQNSHDTYNAGSAATVDLVVAEAERNGISLAFTIWIHQLLRTEDHPWGTGEWRRNGFNQLVDRPEDFFVDDEAWAWQENYYRYVIARWSHSPAIAIWQTITEVNGTNSYEQTDAWHERLNAYFQDHDPYRHPTTATGSGGYWWPAAFEVMDVPQMHVYEQFHANPIEAAEIMADWTIDMWEFQDKPNWIGEYGDRRPGTYPEFSHNATWATFAAGGATTPIEWNDGYDYGRFDDDQAADMARFVAFAEQIPMVQLDPEQLTVTPSDPAARAWGVGSERGGVVWIQDTTGAARSETDVEDLDAMRARPALSGVSISIDGLPDGDYRATPYDTWIGERLAPIPFTCEGDVCRLSLPDFRFDLALELAPS
ncbi:MAG: DUF5060 domain-containing protein [Ilumatobacter fluminis]|uniref:DUF5060 domain-containing protein n=1 Tax=Ilumatobacter fluminis TaxID=467091 RepID=UPI0032EC5E29